MAEKLQRDLTLLASPTAPSDVPLRTLGYAYGLGGLLSIIPDRPLYVSYDISAKVLDMAIQVLKRAGEHDLQVAAVEVDVSWTLIASLMTLGPNFVQTYLPQLLVLWRNALPKPTSRDTTNSSGRNPIEWSFLLHVRESALSAILCFLRHNSPVLVSLDVARRLSSLLNNALQFIAAFLAQINDEQLDQPVASQSGVGLTLRVRESLLRRRIYQCFSSIGFAGVTEATQYSLLQSTITLFASAEGYAGSSVQAAIVSSSGSFNSIWQSTDGYAYGLAYCDTQIEGWEYADKNSNKDIVETYFDELVGVTTAVNFTPIDQTRSSWNDRSSDLVNTTLLLFGNPVLPAFTRLGHRHLPPPRPWSTMQFNCSRCYCQLKIRSLLSAQSKNLWILPEAQDWIETLVDALRF